MSSAKNILSQEELDFLLAPVGGAEQDADENGAAGCPDDAHDGLDDDQYDGLDDEEEDSAEDEADDTAGASFQKNDSTEGSLWPQGRTEAPQPEKLFATLFEKELLRRTDAYICLEYRDTCRTTCGTLMDSLADQACFALLSARPMPGKILFYCPPTLSQALADVSLGAIPPCRDKRPPTHLDQLLVDRLIQPLPFCAAAAWNLPCCELRRHVSKKSDIFLTEENDSVLAASFIFEIESVHDRALLVWRD